MAYKVFFDGPNTYNPLITFHYKGANPNLIDYLIQFINEESARLQEVFVALYIFNNKYLYQQLKSLARQGVKINVISIPLEGYDTKNAKTLIQDDFEQPVYNTPQSKLSLATEIYEDILISDLPNFHMYFFPHVFVRSSKVRPFSRGVLPYSLHIKSFYFKKKNGRTALALTSSNLAVRDQTKFENLIIVDGKKGPMASEQFFRDLMGQSIPIHRFDLSADYNSYPITIKPKIHNAFNQFSAPFYENSNTEIEHFVMERMNAATNKVYCIAQHLSAFKYRIPKEASTDTNSTEEKDGVLVALIKAAKRGLEVKCLSQTYINAEGNPIEGATAPSNTHQFKRFIKVYKELYSAEYAVNDKIHSKYIIIDNELLVLTFNLTASQFMYLPEVEIDRFDHLPGASYKGIHSEVGQLLHIKDPDVVEQYVQNFNSIWEDGTTIKVQSAKT
ncbi:MAG: hypothetical protein AAGH46_13280 [Bacteroidota bacterium]